MFGRSNPLLDSSSYDNVVYWLQCFPKELRKDHPDDATA